MEAGPAIGHGHEGLQRKLTAGALVLVVAYAVIVIRLSSMTSFYTLDDPYIHMALAENIARGHFGVNLGEAANPSSSIVWPWLLAAAEKLGVMLWAPLLINIGCFAATVHVAMGFCLKRLAPEGSPWPAVTFCGLALLAFNLMGVIFTGMEHSLHVLLTLLAVTRAIDGRFDGVAMAALVLSPLVRFEGALVLALGVGAALYDRKFVFALFAFAVPAAVMGLYALWLGGLGLPALPSSVLSKSELSSGSGGVASLAANLVGNLQAPSALMAGVLAAAMVAAVVMRRGRDRVLALGMLAVIVLAFMAGKLMGYARYEVYVLCAAFVAALHLHAAELRGLLVNPLRAGIAGGVIVLLCLRLGPYVLTTTPAAAQNIHRQQYQMHRFVAECWKQPVAINDLGWVSFRNDLYVLDLYGLGNEEARIERAKAEPGWMERLVAKHGVAAAMIYPDWFPELPASWVHVGDLVDEGDIITPHAGTVAIYATTAEAVEPLKACMDSFGAGLPAGVKLHSALDT
jgi:hypothetical protein